MTGKVPRWTALARIRRFRVQTAHALIFKFNAPFVGGQPKAIELKCATAADPRTKFFKTPLVTDRL